MSDDEGNVISLDARRPDPIVPSLTMRPRDYNPACLHTRSIVYAEDRRVYCSTCAVELDPIQVLMGLARDGMQLEAIRAEVARLKQERTELTFETKRLKDTISKQRRKVRS